MLNKSAWHTDFKSLIGKASAEDSGCSLKSIMLLLISLTSPVDFIIWEVVAGNCTNTVYPPFWNERSDTQIAVILAVRLKKTITEQETNL